jgi:predicted CoA-binding protein
MSGKDILAEAKSILLIDYPGRIVPDTLARAGFSVTAHGGPRPDDYFAFETDGGDVIERHIGAPPKHADIVFMYRPLDELDMILESAKAVRAKTIWFQPDDNPPVEKALARAEEDARNEGFAWTSGPILEAANALTAAR